MCAQPRAMSSKNESAHGAQTQGVDITVLRPKKGQPDPCCMPDTLRRAKTALAVEPSVPFAQNLNCVRSGDRTRRVPHGPASPRYRMGRRPMFRRCLGIGDFPLRSVLTMSKIQRFRLMSFYRQHGRCWYCGVRMWLCSSCELQTNLPSQRAAMLIRCTAEHLQARSAGGTDCEPNIVAACWYCNQLRHRGPLPPESAAFRESVRRRISRGKWHANWVFRAGLVAAERGRIDCET